MGIITKLWKTTTEYSLTSKVVVTHDFQRNSAVFSGPTVAAENKNTK